MFSLIPFRALKLAPIIFISGQIAERNLPLEALVPNVALAQPSNSKWVGEKEALAKSWAAQKSIVDAVKAHNSSPAPESKEMNQEKWAKAIITNSLVRALAKNEVASYLKSLQSSHKDLVEAFVSGADGTKVGFISKPTNWTHKGKPKHDDPMKGKLWVGKEEIDESTGKKQAQIAVPVLEGASAIGSLVVGFTLP